MLIVKLIFFNEFFVGNKFLKCLNVENLLTVKIFELLDVKYIFQTKSKVYNVNVSKFVDDPNFLLPSISMHEWIFNLFSNNTNNKTELFADCLNIASVFDFTFSF